ncbi:CsbD family protein [Jannaschia helgolandensis]|uniref:CsbD family protein n=1 Tax=Jannaschia helgolandensis TaxID=188906 RepID=UPI0030D791DE|tara:strand:- start:274 stop:471 length:198 start_codon:yes stop_codon:yes gene_type:complete
MNWDQVQGNWKQFTGKAKQHWAHLTDDDIQQANGDREALEGKIQERYGDDKETAKRKVDNWIDSL